MGCGKIVQTEYLPCVYPVRPEKPVYEKIKWQYNNGLYCVTEDGAKKFLTNKAKQDSYTTMLEDGYKDNKH